MQRGTSLLAMLAVLASPIGAAAQEYRYYHPDSLGSNVLVTNRSGEIVERGVYRPFGQRASSAPEHEDDVRHQFTGQEYDPESELTYFGARYYDPVVGRFISHDPAAFDERLLEVERRPQFLNGYSYVLNRPTRLLDPNGEAPTIGEIYFRERETARKIEAEDSLGVEEPWLEPGDLLNIGKLAGALVLGTVAKQAAKISVKVGRKKLNAPLSLDDTTFTILKNTHISEARWALKEGIPTSGASNNLADALAGRPANYSLTFRTEAQARAHFGSGNLVAVRPREGVDVRAWMSPGSPGPGPIAPGRTGDPFLDSVVPIPGGVKAGDIRGIELPGQLRRSPKSLIKP